MSRRSLLVAHPWMGLGGSEAAAMCVLEALQDDYELSFATASPLHWEKLNSAYGTKVDSEKVKVLKAPALPGVDGPAKMVYLQQRFFERFCNKVADRFDVCVSAYNPISFGKPGVQLIGDFSFSEEMRKRLYIYEQDQFKHRETFFRKCYLKLGELLSINPPPLSERGDMILANSEWCTEQLEKYFDVKGAEIIYPPVNLPSVEVEHERDPLGFVCLGRIVPEKELERIIEILTLVREEGFPVTLRLIGNLDESDYSKHIAALVEERRDWITPEGFLDLPAKQAVLSRQSYALHACRIEAFGIAVAEMASMGCVPFVPSTGGAGEIVRDPGLQFDSNEEAVAKIIAVLKDPEKGKEIRSRLPTEMNRFGPQVFQRELRQFVLRHVHDQEIGATSH